MLLSPYQNTELTFFKSRTLEQSNSRSIITLSREFRTRWKLFEHHVLKVIYCRFSMISRWRKLLLHTYNTYSAYRSTRNSIVCRGFSSNIVSISEPQAPVKEFSFFLEPEEVPPVEKSKNNVSVLEEQHVLEDLSDLGPPIDFQSFNFAAYVNHSNILKKLVDLGVDLYTVEKKTPKPAYLLTLDLDKDIAPRIQ